MEVWCTDSENSSFFLAGKGTGVERLKGGERSEKRRKVNWNWDVTLLNI